MRKLLLVAILVGGLGAIFLVSGCNSRNTDQRSRRYYQDNPRPSNYSNHSDDRFQLLVEHFRSTLQTYRKIRQIDASGSSGEGIYELSQARSDLIEITQMTMQNPSYCQVALNAHLEFSEIEEDSTGGGLRIFCSQNGYSN
jgi:hypothetical protein